ncbi:Protein Skeletor, isoforms B/C [Amphibalanus amphitrite]|uniref:Protein Skeletor, isoforms B/C n=1 Tax=Amphibalanus amphitrite TaxID=1232801 RepID=A0A6A4VJH1_AMPAM|nr:Protein Skeletor, isoforms B/C [Amphibalanus amphitrite]
MCGGKNGVRLLNSALINGFSMLTFQRPLAAGDGFDQAILTNSSQAVIWAIGPVNQAGETSYHQKRTRGNMLLDFGRTPQWNCACNEPADRVFYAQIGPTGGKRGYQAITGRVGWGIAWYINGLLVPEINVVRGQTYTFVVEGGLDPERSAKYHPFYITDDPEGGYEFKSDTEKKVSDRRRKCPRVRRRLSGRSRQGAADSLPGRLCSWKEDPGHPADSHGSFGAYQRTLQLDCEEGQPGILQWTPDADTPDTVYYQCFTHRYLGWKINVVDSCGTGDIDYDADYFYEDSLPQQSVTVEETVVPQSLPQEPTYPSAELTFPSADLTSAEQTYSSQYETPETNQVDLGPSPEAAPERRRGPTNRRGAAPAPARRPMKPQRRRPAPETLQRRRSDGPGRREPPPQLPGVVFGRPLGDPEILSQVPRQAAFQAPPPGHKFNAQDIVLETDFIPVQDSDRNNPPLAFEVDEVEGGDGGPWEDNTVTKKTGAPTEGFAPSNWGAVVFRPDEDPRAAIAAAKNRLRNQPGRRQQQQQQVQRPQRPGGLLSGPGSFLGGLLGFLPGLGGGRRRPQLGRAGNTNPHRLLEVSREKEAGAPRRHHPDQVPAGDSAAGGWDRPRHS